jgi:4'-phosphopantetheinyl transferase
MPVASETIFWTRDIADAAEGPQALVFLADVDDPALRPLLQLAPTPQDLVRVEAYRGAVKERFFACRALLRQLVARKLGCNAEVVSIIADESGAPRLSAPHDSSDTDLFLSISRRGALAALAVAPRPIGVDIEILSEPEDVPVAMLHKSEAERLASLDVAARHKAFLEIWTLKEAYLKALRTGLSREPAAIEVRFEQCGQIRLFDRGQPVTTTACECRSEVLGYEGVILACVML